MRTKHMLWFLSLICILEGTLNVRAEETTDTTKSSDEAENSQTSEGSETDSTPNASEESSKATTESPGLEDGDTMDLVQRLLDNIKNDSTNLSYDQMIRETVMNEHTLNNHKPNAPYFYSNNRYVITDIIELVLDDPDGVIDDTKTTGQLKIYRESVYPDEIEHFFDQESRVTPKVQNPKHDFQNKYLGQTVTGPTNKVVVTLLIKGDEQNLDTLEKRLSYLKNNVRFIDAYPVKGSAPAPKAPEIKPEESKAEKDEKGEKSNEEE